MKKYSIIAFILVLTLTLFCGCRGPMEEATEASTMSPTLAPTAPSQPMPTQAPDTRPAAPETTEGMMDPSDTLESTGSSADGSEPGNSEGSAPGNGSGRARMR